MPPFLPQAQLRAPGNQGNALMRLGQTVADTIAERRSRNALARFTETGDPNALIASGNNQLATLGVSLKNRAEDRRIADTRRAEDVAFREKQLGLSDRRVKLAESEAEAARQRQDAIDRLFGIGGTQQPAAAPQSNDAELLSDAPVSSQPLTPAATTASEAVQAPSGGGILDGFTQRQRQQVQAMALKDPSAAIKLASNFRQSAPAAVEREAEAKETGKLAAKRAAERPKAMARARSAIRKALDVARSANQLRRHGGLEAATGPIESRLLTTRERTANFETALDTLKTKIFVSAINEMRELSKTGGALGQVTEREIEKMENSVENLSLRQGAQSMRSNLQRVAIQFNESMRMISEAHQAEFGSPLKFTPIDVGPILPGGEGSPDAGFQRTSGDVRFRIIN